MPWASSEVISVLAFLLPGFVAAAIFHAFTSHPKPGAFERVILALIFTAIVQAILALLPESIPSKQVDIGDDLSWDPVSPVVVAVIVASVLVVIVNNNLIHGPLGERLPWKRARRFRITRETSHPSEWYSAFASYDVHYVVLHLTGKRRLYGWPTEWTNDPAQGHLRITEAAWLTDYGVNPLDTVEGVLIPVADVEMVEFIQAQIDDSQGRNLWRWLRNQLSRLRER